MSFQNKYTARKGIWQGMELKTLKGELYILTATLCFAFMPILTKFTYRAGANTSQVLFVRFMLASVILWVYVIISRKDYRIGKEGILYLCVSAVFGYFTTAVFSYTALKYISAGLGDLLMYLYPPLIVLTKYVFFKEKISFKGAAALILSMIGIVLIVWTPDMHYNAIGIILGVLSAVSYCFYVMSLDSKRIKKVDSTVITTYIVTFCTITAFVYNLFVSRPSLLPPAGSMPYIILITVFSTVCAILLFCMGVKEIGSSKAAIISTIEPAITTALGAVILKEVISVYTIAGGLLIITGVILLQLGSKKSNGTAYMHEEV